MLVFRQKRDTYLILLFFEAFYDLEQRSKTPSEYCIGTPVFLLMQSIQLFLMSCLIMSE